MYFKFKNTSQVLTLKSWARVSNQSQNLVETYFDKYAAQNFNMCLGRWPDFQKVLSDYITHMDI